jgi:hypothetical protein
MDVQRINQNSSLIGKTVEKSGDKGIISGEVVKISFEGDKTYAHLDNESSSKINVDNITAIY